MFTFIAVILGIMILLICSFFLRKSCIYPVINIQNGWSITHGDVTYQDVTLAASDIGVADLGDVYILAVRLPENSIPYACISFRSINSAVDAYLDHEMIYTWGHRLALDGKMVPKGNQVIPLPADYAGKTLTIRLTSAQNRAFSGFSPVYLGSRQDLFFQAFSHSVFHLFVGVFLLVMGLILLLLSPYVLFSHNTDFRIFFCAIISFLLGSYILAYYDIFNYFTDRISLNTTTEYMSLYLIPVAIAGYMMTSSSGILQKACICFFFTNLIFVLCVVLIALTHTMLISEHTASLHILCLAEGTAIVFLIIRIFRQKKHQHLPDTDTASDTSLLIGIAGFLICAVIDIIKYNFSKYYGSGGEANNNITFTTFGALFFVMCLLVNYFFYRLAEIRSHEKKMQLENLAYSDPLTGLANRARCENYLSCLAGSDQSYFIVSIDLDHLKLVNDTWGHLEGDRWLRNFSTILQEAFWTAALIGRMGGDEFLIVQETKSADDLNSKLQDLQSILSRGKHSAGKIHYGFSYGFAGSSELSETGVSGLYQLADSRMYRMKQQRHLMSPEGGVQ